MDQHNVNGTNIYENLGKVYISYNGTKEDDWLQQYDPLEDNEKKYTDKQKVEKIENILNSERACLIKASEGRGKTFLSRIIAHVYYEKGYEVWFGNITKLNASGESLKRWCKEKKTNCLVILENLHACKNNDDLEHWIGSINTMRKPLWYNNGNNELLFLLNARPTSEDFDTIMSDMGDQVTEKLEPDVEYCKGVASLSDRPIDKKVLDNFLKNNRFGFDKGNANLRLLRIVIEIWESDENILSIENVDEGKIILKFKTKYDLNLLGETEKDYLMFLSSIFQFDIPLPEELLISEEIDFLKKLCNDKHLVIDKDYKFYLPHSVDASYLNKAIGGRQYIIQTQVKILDFVDRILKNETPRVFESDFILLVSGLMARKEEFRDIIKELTEWDRAKVIIEKINSGFTIQLFYTENGHDVNSLRNIYDNNNDILRPYILELSPSLLIRLNYCLTNYLKYPAKKIGLDFFNNTDDLRKYLARWPVIYNVKSLRHKIRRMIKTISEYTTIFEDFCKIPSKPYLNTEQNNPRQLYLSKKTTETFVIALKNGCFDPKRFERLIFGMNKNGFYFKQLNWKSLSMFVNLIKTYMNEQNAKYFKAVTNTIVSEILKQPISFQYASSEQLSRFFYNVLSVDRSFLSRIINDDNVQEDAQNRMRNFEYTLSELYYFYYFYPLPWCKNKMNLLIDNADEEQQKVIKAWHDKVVDGLKKGQKSIEEGTLLAYIHNKFFSGQQNN